MKNTQSSNLIQPSIGALLEKVENKYLLSLLAAKRARQLFEDKEPLIEEQFINNVSTAIHEIAEGKVEYYKSEEHT